MVGVTWGFVRGPTRSLPGNGGSSLCAARIRTSLRELSLEAGYVVAFRAAFSSDMSLGLLFNCDSELDCRSVFAMINGLILLEKTYFVRDFDTNILVSGVSGSAKTQYSCYGSHKKAFLLRGIF